MGKSLIIKGGNFAVNAIQDLAVWRNITSSLQSTSTGRTYLHYPASQYNQIYSFVASSSSYSNRKIYYIDVSQYNGKKIKFTSTGGTNADGNGNLNWQKCFASAINVTMPWTGTGTATNAVTSSTEWQILNLSSGTEVATYELIVPTGANWLIFTSRPGVVSPEVYIEAD